MGGAGNLQKISRDLELLFNQKAQPKVLRRGRRLPRVVDIASRKLCDDAVQYLAPSLEAYKGCTIIDIHPGACQWSASLHDFLKPRRHILMEPEKKYIKPFIQPLLDEPGSTYRHTLLPGAHPRSYWSNYKEIQSDPELVNRPALPSDDPKLRQLDTSILVTGSLARRYVIPSQSHSPFSSVAFSQLIMQHFTWAAMTNSIFHQAGLVRMLLWVPEVYKTMILPPMIPVRAAYNTGLSLSSNVTEVVGVQSNPDISINFGKRLYSRSPGLADAADAVVEKRMQEDKVQCPEGRSILRFMSNESEIDEEDIEDEIKDEEDTEEVRDELRDEEEVEDEMKDERGDWTKSQGMMKSRELKSFLQVPRESVDEFEAAITDLETYHDHVLELYDLSRLAKETIKGRARTRSFKNLMKGVEYPQAFQSLSTQRNSAKNIKTILLTDIQFRLINLEARYCALEEKGSKVAHLKSRLLAADARIQKDTAESAHSLLTRNREKTEDQLAFFANPQVLTYDRRRLEPLQAKIEEFHPQYPLTLLDVTPWSGRDLAVPGIVDRLDAVSTAQLIVKYLFMSQNTSVPTILERIAPNAAKDLIPMVSSITDPRKGGRLNPENVKVRNLSEEMILDLLKAWSEWPFRPTRWELEKSTEMYMDYFKDGV